MRAQGAAAADALSGLPSSPPARWRWLRARLSSPGLQGRLTCQCRHLLVGWPRLRGEAALSSARTGPSSRPQTRSSLVSPSHLGDVRQGGEGWLHRRGCVCGGGRGRVGRRAEPSPGGKAVQAEAPAWARLMYLLWLEYRGGARTWAQEVRPLRPPEQMGHLSRERFGTGLEHREVGRGARGHS